MKRDGDDMEAYVAALLPEQQRAIAMAQLAGCQFERETSMRYVGDYIRRPRRQSWIETSVYHAFLPSGQLVGVFEDIYEGALACLSILNEDETKAKPDALAMFKLLPENEPK